MHQSGALAGVTSERLPMKLVWAESCDTRDEALAMELRIKGWSRAKTMALVRGDWEDLSRLAWGHQKDGPSTRSGRTGPAFAARRN